MATARKTWYGFTRAALITFTQRKLGCSLEELGSSIGLARSTIMLYKRDGGPEILRYALAGVLLERGFPVSDAIAVLHDKIPVDADSHAPSSA